MKKLILFLTLLFVGLGATFEANAQHSPSNNLNYIKLLKTPPIGSVEDSVMVYDSSSSFVKMIPKSSIVAGKENTFSKNTAFNKNFGTTAGTVAEGNDSRILNGQTAFGWGNHVNGGYAFTTGSNINQASFRTALGLGSNAYTSTDYLPIDSTRSTADFNTLTSSGVYKASGIPLNSPGNFVSLITANNDDTGLQIVGGFYADNLYFRGWNLNGANFSAWRKVWHDGNFNPANYLPLTGGTISGNVNVTGMFNGASATFSSKVSTVGVASVIESNGGFNIVSSNVNNDNTSFKIMNSAASKVYAFTAGKQGLTHDGFGLWNVTDNTHPVWVEPNGSISLNSNTTVSGTVTATPATLDTQLATLGQVKGIADLKAPSTGGTGYIQNQNASAQSANMWISGDFKLNGSISSPDNGIPNGQKAFKIEGLPDTSTSVYGSRLSLKPFNYNGISFDYREALSLNSDLSVTFSSTVTALGGNSTNWNTAFGWGNHAGLYPSLTGTDATGTWGINISGLAANSTKWNSENFGANTAGNPVSMLGYNPTTVRWEPKTAAETAAHLGLGSNAYTSTVIPTNTNQLTNGAGFITDISGKVDKVTGKSLIANSEITRLATVTNQDISGKFDKTGGTISGNTSVTGTVTAISFNGSATLTGTPTAPTAPVGTNTTQLATTAFVLANNTTAGALKTLTVGKANWERFKQNSILTGITNHIVGVKAMLVCTEPNNNYVPGDKVDLLQGTYSSGVGSTNAQGISVQIKSTEMFPPTGEIYYTIHDLYIASGWTSNGAANGVIHPVTSQWGLIFIITYID